MLTIAHRCNDSMRLQEAYDGFADFVEVDVNMTADGTLVCWHDHRCAVGLIADLTYEELMGYFPHTRTLDDILRELHELNYPDGNRTSDPMGVMVEIKMPHFYTNERNLNIEGQVVHTLADHGYVLPDDKAMILSFDVSSLRRIRCVFSSKLPLVLNLVDQIVPLGVDGVVNGINVPVNYLVDGSYRHPSAGYDLHTYTINAGRVHPDFDTFPNMVQFLRDIKADGVVTDSPWQTYCALRA